jgi:DNA-binding PadR family transcriptional regulator
MAKSKEQMKLSKDQVAVLSELAKGDKACAGSLTPELLEMVGAGLVATSVVDSEVQVFITARGREVLEEASEGEVNIDKLDDGSAGDDGELG